MFCIQISISKPCRIEFSVSPSYCSLLSHLKFWWSGDLYRQHEIQSRRSAVSGVSINGPPPLATKVLWYYMKSIMPILWHGNSWWCLIVNQLIGSSGSVLFTLCSRGSPRSQDEVYLLPDLGIELGTFCRPSRCSATEEKPIFKCLQDMFSRTQKSYSVNQKYILNSLLHFLAAVGKAILSYSPRSRKLPKISPSQYNHRLFSFIGKTLKWTS